MKNIFLTLCTILTTTVILNAQITEGHVSYKIDASTDDPEMQMVVGMMQGSTLDVYFKEKMTRSEMKMGAMMTMTTITNEESKDVLTLMSGMVGNNAIKSSLTELEENKPEDSPFEVTLVEESKTIEGYLCKKAILTAEDGSESIYWYTTELNVSRKGQSYLNDQIPGYPLQFELNNGPMKMTITMASIETKLDKKKATSLFDMAIPSGYKEMTMEEFQSMGSMGM